MLALRLAFGQFPIQAQQKRQGIGACAIVNAIGGADGGVEGGLGVAEAVGARSFEGALEVAQGPAVAAVI